MTHTAVHSEFVSMGFNRKRRVSFPHDIYQVVVNGEEGEYAEYVCRGKLCRSYRHG